MTAVSLCPKAYGITAMNQQRMAVVRDGICCVRIESS